MTSLFSYVITDDHGFAPNPFGGFCTLATCKPRIRCHARAGDWVLGTGSTRTVGSDRLVYAMKVDEVVPLEEYGRDPRFEVKRPVFGAEPWRRLGDNAYYRENGEWQRRPCWHPREEMDHDLSGLNALVGREFYYFGRDAEELPTELLDLVKTGPGYKRFEDVPVIDHLVGWLRGAFEPGRHGEPWTGAAPARKSDGGAEGPSCGES